MRMSFLSSSFSRWVLPVRVIGMATAMLGLSLIVVAANATSIVIAVIGALIYHAGTLLEERSVEFRRLKETTARDVMLTERIDVPSRRTVASVRESFPGASDRTFFVTLQDGYESGIVLRAQLRAFSEEDARLLPVGQVAQQISDVNAIREDEPLLGALEKIERHHLSHVIVQSASERLVGVVTGKDLAMFSPDRRTTSEDRMRLDAASNEARTSRTVSLEGQDPTPSVAVPAAAGESRFRTPVRNC